MPFWERGSVVPSLIHVGAPKAGCCIGLLQWHDAAARSCYGFQFIHMPAGADWDSQTLSAGATVMCSCLSWLLCVVFFQVVLMLWNSSLPWDNPQFEFVELFSGRGHASKEWSGAHV